jgi:hypothetical protein
VREFVKLADQLPARRLFVKFLTPHKVDAEHKSLIHHVLLNASD